MLLSILGSHRNLLWVGAKTAQSVMYVMPGVCGALWEGTKVLVLYCLPLICNLGLGVHLKLPSFCTAQSVPLLCSPRPDIVDMHLGVFHIPRLALCCVGLLGDGVDFGVRFLFRGCLFLLGFGGGFGLHFLGSNFCCSSLWGSLCFGLRGGINFLRLL